MDVFGMAWTRLGIAGAVVAVAAVLAFVLFPRLTGSARKAVWLVLSAAVAFSPALVPLEPRPFRFVAALLAITVLVKLYDAWHTPEVTEGPSLRESLVDVANGFWLVRRWPPVSVPASSDLRRLLDQAPVTALALLAADFVFEADWSRTSLVIEHLVKVPVAVLAVTLSVNTIASAWRLAGGRAWTPMGDPFTAATPGEFWQRWNVPAQQFFLRYVFLPAGGPRHPVRATMATFFVSGLVHEYVVGIAAGRIVGLQLAYFVLQGLGVLAGRRLQGLPRAIQIPATAAFQLATSALFFASLDAALPFYVERPGSGIL